MSIIPSRGSDQFPLRFPDGMRELIAQTAKANGRSMNSEILNRLEQSFEASKLDLILERLDRIEAAIREGK